MRNIYLRISNLKIIQWINSGIVRPDYRPPFNFLPVFIVLCLICTALHFSWKAYKGVPFIEVNEKGELRLEKSVKNKIDGQIENLEECVQYALLAKTDGVFPCYHCATGQIHLKAGNVWKYGYTCQTNRY